MTASIVLGPVTVNLTGDQSVSDFRSAMAAVTEYAKMGRTPDRSPPLEVRLEPDWTTLGSRISTGAIDRIPLGAGSEAVTAVTGPPENSRLSHWILLGRQTTARGPHHFMALLFYPGVARFLLFRGIHTLHAGMATLDGKKEIAMAAKSGSGLHDEGGAILVSGPRGSGKSTLLMALAQTGGKILSDDLVLVEDRAWGIPEPTVMKKGRVLGRGHVEGGALWLSDSSGPGREISLVLFPVRENLEGRVRRLTPSEGLFRLMNQGAPGPWGVSPLGACGSALNEVFSSARLSVLSRVVSKANFLEVPWKAWKKTNKTPKSFRKVDCANDSEKSLSPDSYCLREILENQFSAVD